MWHNAYCWEGMGKAMPTNVRTGMNIYAIVSRMENLERSVLDAKFKLKYSYK